MPFSLRLDAGTEALLRRLAKAQGRSKSAVVREAVEHYGNRETPADDNARTALDVVHERADELLDGPVLVATVRLRPLAEQVSQPFLAW